MALAACKFAFTPSHPPRGVVGRALVEPWKRISASGSSLSTKIAPQGPNQPRAGRGAYRVEFYLCGVV